MKHALRLFGPVAMALLLAGAARAAVWAPTAVAADGPYDTDVSSISLNGAVAKSWVRHTLNRPARDPKTGGAYSSTIQERFDDCANRRFMLGSYVAQDAAGKMISNGSGDLAGWHEIAPDTIAESIARTVCAVVSPPKAEPIQANLREGSWTDLGPSADGKYHLQVRMDGVVKLEDGLVVAVWRSLYDKPEWADGFGVSIVVSASAIDCAGGKSATLGADFFISPEVRVRSVRTAEKDLAFTVPGPNSYLAKSIKLICASAQTAKADNEGHEGSVSLGTAWGVNKGYLVTASHVIASGRQIEVYDNGEKVGEARVVADDPANDLALLKYTPSKAGKIRILALAAKPAALGRNVFTLGYPEPEALGQHIKMTAGQVSSTAGYQDDARFLQVSVPIQQGNSGGPIIAWDGTVVGVVESKLTRFNESKESLSPEMVNYAVKASYVRAMLEDLPDLANYIVVKPAAGADQLVAEARKAVFMLVVTP